MTYLYLGRIGFFRNKAYRWSHMLNNVASAIFGFIYISLWQAVAPEAATGGDPYTRKVMTDMMILAQVFAWFAVFLPAGLGIHTAIRNGSIALEMARPIPFYPMVLAREIGNVVYQGLYRAIPLALIFAVSVGFPSPATASHLLLTLPSLTLASYIGLMIVYNVGLSSLWTTEIRWAHWTYYSLTTLLSGGWIPADILPGWVGKVAPYLPFASQIYYPVRIYLGLTGASGLLIQLAWAFLLTAWTLFITRRALTHVVVQGG